MSKQDDVSTEPAARRREKRQPHSHHTRNPLLSAVLAQLLGALAAGGLALAFFPPSFVQPLAIAALHPRAVGHVKRLVRLASSQGQAEGLAAERTLFCDLMVDAGSIALMADMNAGRLPITGRG